MRKLAVVAILSLLAIASCDSEGEESSQRPRASNAPPVVTAAPLERFDACPELLTHRRAEAVKRVGPYGLPSVGGGGMAVDMMAGAARGAAETSADSAAPAAPKVSTTNVQEANVDEPDIVK